MEKKDMPIVFGKRNNGIIDNLMDGKKDRLLKLVNMAENGTEEEKITARKKISIYVNRFGFTRKDLRHEKRSLFYRMILCSSNGEYMELVDNQEKAKLIAAFIEDNEFSIQAFLSDYNHPGLVRMISKWLDEKD